MVPVVKKALVVAVVALLVVIGLPVLMPGMGGAHCADCGPAITGAMCVAVLALAASVVLAAVRRRAGLESDSCRGRLLGSQLYRPPRLAFVR